AGLSFRPYMTAASSDFSPALTGGLVSGVTVTAPGFYAPQGRRLRTGTRVKGLLNKLASFRSGSLVLTNMEMETAALYALGRLFGHKLISLNAILAGRQQGVFASDPEKVIRKLILHTLRHI
ncbi:MAG: phosphorylase, partial [Bacteroidota bacterium]